MSSNPKAKSVKWVCCMGDSITNPNASFGVEKINQYPAVIQSWLTNTYGGTYKVRNLGHPGDTTTQMLARFSAMTNKYVPTIATIYGGINDYLQSVSDATTTSNLQSMISQLQTAGCNQILLLNIHTTTSGTDANYNAKRTVIQNVATTSGSGVAFCDLHTVSLVGGDYIDDKHLNASGLAKLSTKIESTLTSLGWK